VARQLSIPGSGDSGRTVNLSRGIVNGGRAVDFRHSSDF
jgi:hypothetical protein